MRFKRLCVPLHKDKQAVSSRAQTGLSSATLLKRFMLLFASRCCVSGMPLEPVNCQEQKEDGMCLWEAKECHSRTRWRGMNCGKVHFVPRTLRMAGGTRRCTRTGTGDDSSSAKPNLSSQPSSLLLRGIAPPSQDSSLDGL